MTAREQNMHQCIENDYEYFNQNRLKGMTDPRAISLTYGHLAHMAATFGWNNYDMQDYVKLADARGIEIYCDCKKYLK